jgi:hypothetical protein
MKILLNGLKIIILWGILGAVVYQVQHYCIGEILSMAHIKRHFQLANTYDPWPLGAVLGIFTGSALVAIRMHQPQVAARICIAVGALIAT